MNNKLDNYLVEKYPKIFKDRYADIKTSSMCFGFECQDGWFWLIDQLCNSIQDYIDSNKDYSKNKIYQVVATQVKEKFGGLCFYYNGGDDYIFGMTRLIENMSYNVCEFCGSIHEVGRTSGWIYTICKECYDSSNEERITRLKWQLNEYSVSADLTKSLRKIKIDKLINNL